MLKLGDAVASIATPIARMVGANCVDPVTKQLRPGSTCNKVRQDLNDGRYADAFYDRFWNKAKQRRQANAGDK